MIESRNTLKKHTSFFPRDVSGAILFRAERFTALAPCAIFARKNVFLMSKTYIFDILRIFNNHTKKTDKMTQSGDLTEKKK